MKAPAVAVVEKRPKKPLTVDQKERRLRALDKDIRREFWYLESWMKRNPGLVFQRWELESPSFRTYIEFRKERIKAKYAEFQEVLGVDGKHDGDWSIEKEIEHSLRTTREQAKRRAV